MKISLKWLKDYIDLELDDNQVSDALTSLGLECNIISKGFSFSNVVLGKVLEVVDHSDSDHLKICTVDIGQKELSQIICGANNVKPNMFVPVAKVGSTLNNGEFKIKKAKLRGIESFGMICSEKELDVSNNHDGIMEIEKKSEFNLGDSIENVLALSMDTIFEIDLTPNRGDCFSHLGVARELAIFTKQKINIRKFDLSSSKGNINDYITITNEATDSCYRYACRLVKNVRIEESPSWLKEKLISINQKSINNIVDAGNFIMHDYGHPMHTFDYNKISKKEIIIRNAKSGEKIKTLDGEDRILNDNQLLVSDPNKVIALAGIMGCENSEITNKTTDVLIECAYFDPIKIRKGSKKIDLSTESSKRFERDTDIVNMMNALDNLAFLIADLGSGEVIQGLIDSYDKVKNNNVVSFDLDQCNKFLGTDISKKEIDNIFDLLNFKNKDNSWVVPSYRNDIEREVDLYEEVARIFGYDNIPSALNFSNSYSAIKQGNESINNNIKNILYSKGFNEHYSNSLYNDSVLSDFNNNKTSEIINESSKDMKYLRNSLLPGLLNAVSFNEKRGQRCFKFFEIGRVHSLFKSYNKEQDNIGLIWYGENKDHWKNKFEMDIYYAKGEILALLDQLKVNSITFKIEKTEFSKLNINIYSKKTCIGFLRALNSDLKNKYDINGPILISEIFIDKLNQNIIKDFNYKKISTFPSVRRDLSLLLDVEINSEDIINYIFDCSDNLLKEANVFDVYIGKELENNSKSLAISLVFQSDQKTLVDKEVDERLSSILNKIKVKFEAIQR